MGDAALFLGEILSTCTGGDAYGYDLIAAHDGDPPPYADIEWFLRDYSRLPITSVLAGDIERAYQELPPLAFMSHQRAVDEYRERRGITLPREDESECGLVHIGEVALRALLEQQADIERYGYPLWTYRSGGVACRREQAHFYQSEEWATRARVARTVARFRCEACGSTEGEMHVHHERPIYSAFSERSFHFNFDICYLRALCKPCHVRFHQQHERVGTQFARATPADKALAPNNYRALHRAHESARECRWCQTAVWQTERAEA